MSDQTASTYADQGVVRTRWLLVETARTVTEMVAWAEATAAVTPDQRALLAKIGQAVEVAVLGMGVEVDTDS